MNSYLVSYDLIKRKDYPELWKALEAYNYWHCLGSTWIIKSDKTVAEVFDDLRQHTDSDDKLIVLAYGVKGAKWSNSFSENCSDWLTNNL